MNRDRRPTFRTLRERVRLSPELLEEHRRELLVAFDDAHDRLRDEVREALRTAKDRGAFFSLAGWELADAETRAVFDRRRRKVGAP